MALIEREALLKVLDKYINLSLYPCCNVHLFCFKATSFLSRPPPVLHPAPWGAGAEKGQYYPFSELL